MMEAIAKHRFARTSAQKARLVADQANAEHNEGADIDTLKVATIMVDEGPTMKRIRPRAKGRADRILKRTSHITVVVSDR